ncbi:MAG: YwaF family protein [Clostridia bacterium]|nr:YwaF family protein [Clostridia bacterium]
MKFEMWSIWHILYILSPFIIFAIMYFVLRNKSERTKYIVGIILGAMSIICIVLRNVDIYIRSGWNAEVIPLQVCHIGSIMVGLALILKKNWLSIIAFCFNLMPALLAMVFADSLANYDTILKIRPQTYIWGHILIVVGALYCMFMYKNNLNKRDLKRSLIFVAGCLLVAILCNNLFRLWFEWEPNYFYLYSYKGTPLKFLYNAIPTSMYGWFQINWLYTLSLIAVFVVVYLVLYLLAKTITKNKIKDNK